MATFFTTLFTALGGSAGGATAAAGGAAASSGFSLTSILSAGSTIVGGLASIAAGNAQAASLNAQADQAEIQASQDELQGRQEAVNAIRDMNQQMASGLVASYASGLNTMGSTTVALDQAKEVGERNASMARDTAAATAAARRQSASQLRQDASAAKTGGIFGAISGALQFGSRKYSRG